MKRVIPKFFYLGRLPAQPFNCLYKRVTQIFQLVLPMLTMFYYCRDKNVSLRSVILNGVPHSKELVYV